MKTLIALVLLTVLAVSCTRTTPAQPDSKTVVVDPKKEAREKLELYRLQVINGEMTMEDAAKKYSEDPGSASNGGLYQNIERGQFVPEFEAAAFALKPGEYSGVFETEYGFHFVQLVAKRGEVIDVRHVLIMPKQ